MINRLKKYRFSIIALLILAGLLFFFIPSEERRYLQPDLEIIKSKSFSVVLWTEIILFTVLLILGLRQLKKTTDLFLLIAGLAMMSFALYLPMNPIFLSATFFLNKISKNKKVEKKYIVVYVDTQKEFLLLSENKQKETVQAKHLIDSARLNIKEADTLVVSFTKGLLGFNFDPTIKAINNTPVH